MTKKNQPVKMGPKPEPEMKIDIRTVARVMSNIEIVIDAKEMLLSLSRAGKACMCPYSQFKNRCNSRCPKFNVTLELHQESKQEALVVTVGCFDTSRLVLPIVDEKKPVSVKKEIKPTKSK